jgi:hypothetical protein
MSAPLLAAVAREQLHRDMPIGARELAALARVPEMQIEQCIATGEIAATSWGVDGWEGAAGPWRIGARDARLWLETKLGISVD